MDLETYTATAIASYIVTALWATTGDPKPGENNGDPLDADYDPDDLAPSAVAQITEDVNAMIGSVVEEFGEERLFAIDPGQFGHDLLLTRDHHGAGFWDRGLGEFGDWLTGMAHPYGDSGLYVGDDGKVYV